MPPIGGHLSGVKLTAPRSASKLRRVLASRKLPRVSLWQHFYPIKGASLIYPLTEWTTLLAVLAGASATLTGLVFVAVSINLERIISFPGLAGRAGESLLQFLQVFFVAILALVPRESLKAFAVEILMVAGVSGILQLIGQLRYMRRREGHPLTWITYRMALSQIATAPFLVAGIELLIDFPSGLYWLVPGFVFSFVAGIFSAWVLLVEILR